ncbi:caspase domain-containing protein [Flagelloscypha sp. PMI_526]|nr:caspase domain-containing protein [Flagelloscypha sp. PMI_526]
MVVSPYRWPSQGPPSYNPGPPMPSMAMPVAVPSGDYLGPPSSGFRPQSAPQGGGFAMPSPAPSFSSGHSPLPSPSPYDTSKSGGGYNPSYIHVESHSHHTLHKKHHSATRIQQSYSNSQVLQVPQSHPMQHGHSHSTQHLPISQAQQQQQYLPSKPAHSKPSAPSNHSQLVHPKFAYSTCQGKKKALCIGINYPGTKWALRGCINDAKHMRDALIAYWGYKGEDIVLLTDDSRDPRSHPTKKNILAAMKWLVKDAHTNDSLFLHYSGHGGQTKDRDGDEADGYDEVIYPMDYMRVGHIVDDEMHKILVSPLPRGCRLTALFDSCHSGTVLDLPFAYDTSGRLKGEHVTGHARAQKETSADVIQWSGCKDGQTSADTTAAGVAVGAMSHAFISVLKRHPVISYNDMLVQVRDILKKKYSQKPQMGSSHPIDTSLRFII